MTAQSKAGLLALSLTLAAFVPLYGFAQAAAAPATPAKGPSRIAFVNIQQAVFTCNEGKQEAAALQKRFSAREAALKQQNDELKKLKDDFQAVSAKLNDDDRNSRARTIQEKQKTFERDYADYQSEVQEAQQEAVSRILKKMMPVLEKYLVDNGYTAVFDVSNPQTPVLWARGDAMITKELVDAYNAQSAATTAAPAPTPRAAPAPTPKPK
jgi:outer membrane protein